MSKKNVILLTLSQIGLGSLVGLACGWLSLFIFSNLIGQGLIGNRAQHGFWIGLFLLISFGVVYGSAIVGVGEGVGGGADENHTGELHIINPAGTTYAKHFYGITFVQQAYGGSASGTIWWTSHFHGYVNSTAKIDAVKFYWGGGTHDSGTFKMWGIK